MKILTKEWMQLNRQVMLAGQTKDIEGLESKAPFTLLNSLYDKKLLEAIETEKENPVYDEEETGIKNKFDKDYAIKLFKAKTAYNEELVRAMPNSITEHIHNFKLLSLYYCTQDEIDHLQDFYNEGIERMKGM